MLDRTARVAAEHGVADQVTTRLADVEELPFEDRSFDLVVSFTGLHCFPDPARAVVELARVLKLGGVLTGSALLNDTGLRYEPMRRAGRLAGLLGPGCTSDQVAALAGPPGRGRRDARRLRAMGYFRGYAGLTRRPHCNCETLLAGLSRSVHGSGPRVSGSRLRPAAGGGLRLVGSSLNRWNDARTSASASVRPTHSAPSTDLPGSRSL